MAKSKKVVPTSLKDVSEQLSQLYSQQFVSFAREVRPKLASINFDTLEKLAEANPLVSAIINKRCQQVRPFCKISKNSDDRGFVIRPIDDEGEPNKERIKELQNFFINTGFGYDPEREDDLPDVVQLLVRDVLTFDQNAIEIRRTRKGEVFDFWYIDGTSVVRVDKKSPAFGQGYSFIQRDENQKILAYYRPKDMIFDYANKRGRLKYRGYGYSNCEQMIDLLTTFLFSLTYNKDQFIRNRIPKGFLKITGEVDQKTLNALRNHWVAEMSGYGAQFAVPMIPSGKDGVGIDWQQLGQSNRDMEYNKLVMFLTMLVCAVFAIDPAELGIKPDNSQSVIGDSGEARIQASKDTGLSSLLSYLETILNKVLKMIDPDYVLEFVGVKDDDQDKKEKIIKQQIESRVTIDEIRIAEGKKPFNQPWSQVVLNPQAVQIFQGMPQPGDQQGIEEQQSDQEQSGEPAFEIDESNIEPVDEDEEEASEDGMQKSKNNRDWLEINIE